MPENKPPVLDVLDKPKLSRMYVIYIDDAPMLVTESFDSQEEVLEQFKQALTLPEDREFYIAEVYDAPVKDLERVKLVLELRAGLFNMQQIAMALRAGKSGLVLATGPGGPLQ